MHLLTYLLEQNKEAVVSAMTASPDVALQAQEATGLSYEDDLTDKQDLRLCAARHRIALGYVDSLLAYLPGELPTPEHQDAPGCATLQTNAPPIPFPEELTAPPPHPEVYFKGLCNQGQEALDEFYKGVQDCTLNPIDFNPDRGYVWAPRYQAMNDSDDGTPCATVYDKDGTIIQIGTQGACACVNNYDTGLCLEDWSSIVEVLNAQQ